MSCNSEHYYALHTFLEDDELHEIWNIVEKAMNRHGYDVSNSELSMRLYDQELEENIEHDIGKLARQFIRRVKTMVDKVDVLVDSMGVTENKLAQGHVRKDLDAL